MAITYFIGGVGFAAGGWVIYRAVQRQRYLQQQRAHAAANDETHESLAGADLRRFASGCVPVIAVGLIIMALGLSAVALLVDTRGALSPFDVLGFLFFVLAYVGTMVWRSVESLQRH